jgi:hypothetical protein
MKPIRVWCVLALGLGSWGLSFEVEVEVCCWYLACSCLDWEDATRVHGVVLFAGCGFLDRGVLCRLLRRDHVSLPSLTCIMDGR